jgi:hypothetical protein
MSILRLCHPPLEAAHSGVCVAQKVDHRPLNLGDWVNPRATERGEESLDRA